MAERDSKTERPALPPDLTPEEKADREALNGILQFDRVRELVADAVDGGRRFKLRPSLIMELNGIAVQGLEEDAGRYRLGPVSIRNSQHVPPPFEQVPALVDDLCDYVNDHWADGPPLHLAAYIMWRVNWIHPFSEGNGRTSRACSYMVLCIALGYELPGDRTIADLISDDRKLYYHALDEADAAWNAGALDVSEMEELLRDYLASQLVGVLDKASGANVPEAT